MEHLARDSCHLNLIPNRFTAHHCTLRFYHFDGFFRGELAHKNLENPSAVSGTPTDIVDDRGRTVCCSGGVGSIVHNRALTGRVPEPLWLTGWWCFRR